MNKGTLIGFISSDIKSENITLKNGETMKKIGFNIACQRKGKGAGADFPRLVAFGKTAEVIEQYMSKGRGCIIEFHVQTGSYTNKEGKKIYSTDLVCDSIEFPPVKKNEESQDYSDNTHTSESGGATFGEMVANQNEPPKQQEEEFINIPENISDDELDDLPFR